MRIMYFLLILLLLGCGHSKIQKIEEIDFKDIDTLVIGKKYNTEISFKELDKVVIDLNGDNKKDTITLFSKINDEEFFTRVVFKISGSKKKIIFDNEDGWEAIYPSFLKNNKNVIKSKNIFVYSNHDSAKQIVLLCGQVFEGGTISSLFLIDNDSVNKIDLTEFENPITITDLGNDGSINIIGNNIGEMESQLDNLNADVIAYRPFFVYDIKAEGLSLNKDLTRKYNEKHYVWAGIDSIGKVRLLQYRDGSRPKILK